MRSNFTIIAALVLISISLKSCNKTPEDPLPVDPVPIDLTADQVQLVESGNDFAFEIFRKVIENEDANKNIIISPLSISVALSMTLNGAEGTTKELIIETLRSNGLSTEEINKSYKALSEALLSVDKRVLISIANSVWTEENFPVKKPFIDNLTGFYKAESKNFSKSNLPEAITNINGWIDGETNGLIKEMLNKLDPGTVMLLANAIYFKGKWNSRFDKDKTVDEPFYLSGEQSSEVPMMKQTNKFKVFRGEDFTFAEFPYGQGNYVMDVLLPGNNDGVNSIIRSLTHEGFNEITKSMSAQEINLSFPRFRYGFKKELNEILTQMGMGLAFTERADFKGISDIALMISIVLHQAFIETNEEGTEAAAATVVGFVGLTSLPLEPMVLRFDHPFMFVIRETTTNSILFMGRVSDPSAI